VSRQLAALPGAGERSACAWSLVVRMRELGAALAGTRLRHFENSDVHRFRQRLYQTLLILLPHFQGQHVVRTVCSLYVPKSFVINYLYLDPQFGSGFHGSEGGIPAKIRVYRL
jgi:hypothetical protein